MPGYTKEDIVLKLDGYMITIGAMKKELPVEEHSTYYRRERTRGHITRSMKLPHDCDVNNVDVVYCHGVVKVTFQKVKSASSTHRTLLIK